jgi:hypothetical protein
MDAADKPYLERAFGRLLDEAVSSARVGRQRVLAEFAKSSALQNGRTLVYIAAEYERVGVETADKIARIAFEKTGSTDEDVCKTIESGLCRLRDALFNDLASSFRTHANWGSGAAITSQRNGLDRHIVAVLDDFRHGILGGNRLTKDPLVNFVASISDSPGAVLQTGVGIVQHALTVVGANELRTALREFIASEEVQALPRDKKESVEDVADVLGDELTKQHPNAAKVTRWGKRLLGIAQEVGVAVAAGGVTKLLFG